MTVELNIRIKNQRAIVDKLRLRSQAMAPDSPAMKRALTRAALTIVNQAKINIRRHRLIDTGRLINSLRFEFYRPDSDSVGVRIGSFGVPYAAFWEFGFHGRMRVRSHNRLITQAFGKNLVPPVLARISGHIRNRSQIAKPFLRPAYELHKSKVAQLINEAMQQG